MTPHVADLLDSELSLRVALALLHFLWQGVAVGAVAAVACALLRKAAATTRHAVLLAAMGLMALCPLVTFFALRPPPAAGPVVAAAPSDGRAPVVARTVKTRGEGTDRVPPDVATSTGPAAGGAGTTATPGATAAAMPAGSAPPGNAARRTGLARLRPFAPWMTLAYLLGVAAMTLRLLLALRGGQRLRRRAVPVTESHVLDALARQARRLGLRREPAVAWCHSVVTPAVVGVVRPAVLLPVALSTGMSAQQIETILAHELAHVRRLDPLVNVLQGLVEALLFFHPVVWYVSGRLRAEREDCCDDMVVAAGGAPVDYVRSLVRAAELGLLGNEGAVPPGVSALAAVGRPSELRRRVARLLQREPAPQLRVSPAPVVLLLAVAGVVTAGAWYQVAGAQSPGDGDPAAPAFVGRLVDPEGRPVSNAYVGPAGSNLYEGARTDSNGVFRLSNIRPAQKRWAVYSQRSRRMALFKVPSKASPDPVPVTLHYRAANAEGRVVGSDGNPVPGVKVTVRVTTPEGDRYDLPAYRETDAYGRYAAPFTPSGETLKTQAAVGEDATAAVSAGRVYDIEMPDLVAGRPGKAPDKPEPPRVRYSGRVVDDDGKPVAGAELQMYYPKNNMLGSAGTAITDADGRFSRLIPADAERVDFRLSHPECISYQFEFDRPPPPVRALRDGSAVLVMKRGHSIRGVVKGPDGRPLANALVMAAAAYGTTPGPENEVNEDFTSPRTAMDGSFRVGGLPAGRLDVMVAADGLAPKIEPVEVKADAPPLEIALEQGKTYAGRVVDPDGRPVEGATVYATDWRNGRRERRGSNRWTRTDADGRFTLSGLPNEGTMRIGYGKSPDFLSMSAEWPAAGPAADALRLYPKPVVRGRVVDAATGEPVKAFRAVAFWGNPPVPLSFNRPAEGNDDGSFALTIDRVILRNPEATPFYAEIEARGYVPQLTPPVIAGRAYEPPVIKLEKGEPIAGVVTDVDQNPLEGATVALVAPGNVAYSVEGFKFSAFQTAPARQAKTDAAGRFELPPAKGEGQLVVLHERGYVVLPFPPLPAGAKVAVLPWARVEGVARRDGKPLHGVQVTLNPAGGNALGGGRLHFTLRATTHTDGRFVFEHVPAAPWRLQVGQGESVELAPEPGQTKTVEVGGPAKPQVGATDAPPPGAAVASDPAPDEPVPEAYAALLRASRARTLHWKQTDVNGYGGPRGGKVQTLGHEIWRDVERNFERDRYSDDVKREDGQLTNDGERFEDDELTTVIYHSDRQVAHWRANPLARAAEARELGADLLTRVGVIAPVALRNVAKAGREAVGGVECDVWHGPFYGWGDRRRLTAWVSVADGRLKRIQTVPDRGAQRRNSRTIEVLEYDKPMPARFFRALEIPADYARNAAPAAAPMAAFSRGFATGGRFKVELAFTLADGSVVVCWNHFPGAPDHLKRHHAFDGVAFGGPLPRLPTVLARLYADTGADTEPADGVEGETEYAGRHLAVTTNGEGETFEWALYVPARRPPPRDRLYGYTLEFTTRDGSDRQKMSNEVRLRSDDDFDTFVRGAMAQYSADGNAPGEVTAERVKALAAEVK